jgi:hypothetical protein
MPVARAVVIGITWLLCGAPALAQSASREPTDVHIRRLAGLPADSVKGDIEIIEVGHHPMETMLSIVGNRTKAGWAVSFACASSPQCGAGTDHAAKSYTLSAAATAEVDRLLNELRTDREPDGQLPSRGVVGGYLSALINYQGFTREYRRVGVWGKTLGRLEALMADPAR